MDMLQLNESMVQCERQLRLQWLREKILRPLNRPDIERTLLWQRRQQVCQVDEF
jgi:hypothetical protein